MRSSRSAKRLTDPCRSDVKRILDEKAEHYNNPAFIPGDPISVPHQYAKLQDIEIAAFWTAMLSWGQRSTIIAKAEELMSLMDRSPHDFILHHQESDLKKMMDFKHRTFLTDDTLYFISFFKWYYEHYDSLEEAFLLPVGSDIKSRLSAFHDLFFSLPDSPQRTRKHVSTPERKSSCKRLNMFLRWMVRNDDRGVDFGLWKGIDPSSLMIPLDIHVFRVATSLGLLDRRQADWVAVESLTSILSEFDPTDPVRYDYALFSMGVVERS